MEFFGYTLYGPQNYFEDVRRIDYKEPMTKNEVGPVIEKVVANSTCPKEVRNFLIYTISHSRHCIKILSTIVRAS